MRLSVLIVGLGQIGMWYDLRLDLNEYAYSHARAFSQHERFTLVAGVDIAQQNRKKFEENYHCPSYLTVDEALQKHEPDIVVIAVPTSLHCQELLNVLEQCTPQLVLCEKPLSYNLEEADTMLKACEARGVKLFVNYMRRSDSAVAEIKRRLDCGEIEKGLKGVVWYSGGFFHNGSHFFNLVQHWLGEVHCSTIINEGCGSGEQDQDPDIHVGFERGSVIFLAAWEEAFSHYTVELVSPSGRLRYESGGEKVFWQRSIADSCFDGYTILSDDVEIIDSGMKRYQWHVVEQLVKAVDGKDALLCSGLDAFNTLKIMKQTVK